MRLLGRKLLIPLHGLNSETDQWLVSWTSEVAHANWKTPDEVIRQYPNVKFVPDTQFRFRVAAQNQSIETIIAFPHGVAMITALGLHTEVC
jgi:mRNA-degrading endonuclease HigB of HigAB toxin-antitoxin module